MIGSGAGGATTAAVLAEGGRAVHGRSRRGPALEPGAVEPFSLEELARSYRHRGSSAALGLPPVAYAEGCCVGGSTEVNSGLWNRLPDALGERWRDRARPGRVHARRARRLRRPGRGLARASAAARASCRPSSAVLERGAEALGWRHDEFPRAFRYDERGRGTKQTMSRTRAPAGDRGRAPRSSPACGCSGWCVDGDRVVAVEAVPHAPRTARSEPVTIARRAGRRVRGRDPDARAPPAQRAPARHRRRAQGAPHA